MFSLVCAIFVGIPACLDILLPLNIFFLFASFWHRLGRAALELSQPVRRFYCRLINIILSYFILAPSQIFLV